MPVIVKKIHLQLCQVDREEIFVIVSFIPVRIQTCVFFMPDGLTFVTTYTMQLIGFQVLFKEAVNCRDANRR